MMISLRSWSSVYHRSGVLFTQFFIFCDFYGENSLGESDAVRFMANVPWSGDRADVSVITEPIDF